MDAISEQLKEVLSSLQDVKVKQTIFESNFMQQQSNQEFDFTFDENEIDEKSANSEQVAEMNSLRKAIKQIEKKVHYLRSIIQNFEKQLDDLEQYGRSNCLVLHGSGINSNPNYNSFVNEIMKKFNEKLKLSQEIVKQDIDIAHCLPSTSKKTKSGKNYTPPIIIKFTRRSVRNEIFASKSNLVGSGISITESLTKRRLLLLKKAQQKFGLKNTGTMKGNVYVAIKGIKKTIRTYDDIDDLAEDLAEDQHTGNQPVY